MKLNPRQLALHWRLFAAVKRLKMPGRATFTKFEEDELRHGIYVDAGVTFPDGTPKSLTKVSNSDFTKIVAAFKAIIEPGNLNAQLHALRDETNRYRYAIRKSARDLGVDDSYVAGIVRAMNADGKLGSSDLDSLHPPELKKVLIAMRVHKHRYKSMVVATEQVTAQQGDPF